MGSGVGDDGFLGVMFGRGEEEMGWDLILGWTDGCLGMTWGWVIAMVGIQSVACSMAELCSSMPTSGGLYYASAVLAPPGWGPFAAWITGRL